MLRYPRQILIVVGLTAGGTTAFYTYTTYMQKFLKLSVGLSDNQTTIVSAGSLIFALCLQPIYGALSDKIGRRPLLIWFGLMGTVFTVPLLRSLQSAKTAFAAFLLIAAAWVIVAGYTSINAVVKAELFPTAVRATGVGLPFAVTTSIFGDQPSRSHFGSSRLATKPGFHIIVFRNRNFARGLTYNARHEALFGYRPSRLNRLEYSGRKKLQAVVYDSA